MKRIASVEAVVLCILLSGCGSLHQRVSFDHLTRENMEFVDSAPPGDLSLNLKVGSEELSTDQTASYMVPTLPLLYVKTLGTSYGEYGLMTQFHIIPVFISARGSIFDDSGKCKHKMWMAAVPIVVSAASATSDLGTPDEKSPWMVGFGNVPYLGPFFGFGRQYLRLMWIPILSPGD